MYEYAITLLVIAIENDDSLADKYFAHSLKNAKKKVTSYTNNYKELRFKPLSKRTFDNLKKQEDSINAKYGKGFLDNEYGWADGLFPNNQKASLRALEDKVEMKKYRPYYLACTDHTHSNFNGLKSHMFNNRIILNRIHQREIDLEAFIDPMQFTISILYEVTDYILYTFSAESEYNINSNFLLKVFKSMQETFTTEKM